MTELPFLGFVDEFLVYLAASFIAVILVSLIIILKMKKSKKKSSIDREKVLDLITRITKEKAQLKARDSVISEALKYGKITQAEANDQRTRNNAKLEKLNREIESKIDSIAEGYFAYAFQKEAALDHDKVSYLVEMQKKIKELENEIFVLKEQLKQSGKKTEEVSKDYSRAKQQLNTVESQQKEKIISLERELDSLKKLKGAVKKEEPSKQGKYQEKMDEYYHKNLLFDLLVKRYGDYLDEHESKTIQDLKDSVQPRNTNIVEIAEVLMKSIPDYNADKDVVKASEKAYNFVTEKIHSVPSLGVNFWMSIKEILDNSVADYEDKSMLLCSLLKALGGEATVGIVEMSDGSNRPVVFLKTKDAEILCDPNEKHDFLEYAGERGEILGKYAVKGESITKILYEFDDKEYKEY